MMQWKRRSSRKQVCYFVTLLLFQLFLEILKTTFKHLVRTSSALITRLRGKGAVWNYLTSCLKYIIKEPPTLGSVWVCPQPGGGVARSWSPLYCNHLALCFFNAELFHFGGRVKEGSLVENRLPWNYCNFKFYLLTVVTKSLSLLWKCLLSLPNTKKPRGSPVFWKVVSSGRDKGSQA